MSTQNIDVNTQSSLHQHLQAVRAQLAGVVVGQEHLIDVLLVAAITRGHVLVEGVPGLAKTLTVRAFAQCLGGDFVRLQFTPDLLPADIVGTKVFNPHDVSFSTRKGPLFANFVLADEINRAPAKVQSALLEAMQEHQVTIEGETLDLPKPFVVVATQNPLEHEGTYPLPEAQIDRFMFKTVVGYPTREQEDAMIDIWADRSPEVSLKQLLTPDLVAVFRRYTADVTMAPKIRQYILDLVRATRPGEHVEIAGTGQWLRQELPVLITHGASPRAVLALHQAARAWALCQGRQHVVPQDVQDMAYDVLRHRLSLSYEAEAENISSDVILQKLLETVPVP